MMARRTVTRKYGLLLVFTLLFCGLFYVRAAAQEDCSERKLRDLGVAVIDCTGAPVCSPAASAAARAGRILPAGSSVYILGDSITFSAQNNLQTQITDAGFTIAGINANSGRAISLATSGGSTGLEGVEQDRATIAGAGAIVVALGTNSRNEDVNVQIPALVAALRAAPSSAPIYWVNMFYTTNPTGRDERNAAISANAISSRYTVINASTANIELRGDGVHPTTAGNLTFAQMIVNGLRGPQTPGEARGAASQISGGCACQLPGTGGPGPSGGAQPDENGVYPIVGGVSLDGNPYHILSYPSGLDEQAATDAINIYILERQPDSPFVGLGSSFVAGGKLYNVNPFLAVGHLQHENGFATAGSGWHTTTPPSYNAFGRSASESQPHTTYTTSSGRQRLVFQWTSWAASLDGNNGAEDPWFALINRRYLANSDDSFRIASGDFATYISHYAPGSDGNNEGGYVSGLHDTIDSIVTIMEGGAAYTGPTGSAGGSCPPQGGNGIVNLDGYSFPLAPQNKSIGGIVENQVETLHTHDNTAAFDLSYSDVAGKAVYAIDDGVIDNVRTQEEGWCQSVQLRAADGYYYWYGHLIDVLVANDEPVVAGQQIASVATWTPEHTCNGTSGAAHLHIDRGCTVSGVRQPGGTDACRDPEFIPFLSALFATLPD